jgi:predicted transcriptional regulator
LPYAKKEKGMNKTRIEVREWMSTPVQVVHPDTPVGDAYNLMMHKSIRRLPVVRDGKLVGIVTLGDLREARPSPATSLSIYELNYLLSRLTVGQVMTHHPYTVTPSTPIQHAARIMLEHKVSGLPVVTDTPDAPGAPGTPSDAPQAGGGHEEGGEEGEVVGIITESDIFRMLIDQWDYFTSQHVDPGFVASLIAEEMRV